MTWPTKKLCELLETCDAGTWGKPAPEGKGLLVLRSTNIINGGRLDFTDVAELDIQGKIEKLKLLNGDILLEKSGGGPDQPVGRVVYFIAPNHRAYTFANFIQRLRANSRFIDSHFLFYCLLFLHKIGFTKKLQSQTTGIRNLKLSLYLKTDILTPPLKIQKQIVERLDKIAEAQKLNDELIQKSDELFQSLLHKELNPADKNWEIKKLGEVADFINGKAFKPKDWGKKGLPIIRIQNLNNKDANFNYYNGSVEEKYLIHNGDLLLSWSGNIGTSFGAFIWNNGDAVLNQHIFNIKIVDTNLDKNYFYFFINKIVAEIEGKTHGITGLVHITKGTLEKIKIPFPPFKIQKQIVEKLSAAQEYKNQLLAQKLKLKELFESVLNKSMKGEL